MTDHEKAAPSKANEMFTKDELIEAIEKNGKFPVVSLGARGVVSRELVSEAIDAFDDKHETESIFSRVIYWRKPSK